MSSWTDHQSPAKWPPRPQHTSLCGGKEISKHSIYSERKQVFSHLLWVCTLLWAWLRFLCIPWCNVTESSFPLSSWVVYWTLLSGLLSRLQEAISSLHLFLSNALCFFGITIQSYCVSLLGRLKYMRAGMCENVLCYLWVQGPESYPRNTDCCQAGRGRDKEVRVSQGFPIFRLVCLASMFTGCHKLLFYRTLKFSAMCVCVVCVWIYLPHHFVDITPQLDFF